MISIKNLSKHYQLNGQSFAALNNINLEIEQGEIFAIIGSSGAGKSTLLRSINLLETPDQGQVTIKDTELTQLAPPALRQQRQKIGMIFQHFNLINNKTVFENIALPLKLSGQQQDLSDKVNQLLSLVELSDKAASYPSQLSGGQKQRVAIARALINQPSILLCDEATSALDPNTTKEVLSLLKRINQQLKLTIVMVTHEMDVVRQICHRFAVLEKGQLTEVDSIEAVFKKHPKTHLLLDGLQPTLPQYIKQKLQPTPAAGLAPLCQIMFYGEVSQQAIISHLSQTYQVELNILLANIDVIGNHTFGIMILQMIGEASKQQQVYQYLETQQLNVEVLGYV